MPRRGSRRPVFSRLQATISVLKGIGGLSTRWLEAAAATGDPSDGKVATPVG